jgi:hypothetical protein
MFRAALILSLLASPALAFKARNDAYVSGSAEEIVVASRPGLASSESWCAAGDFVIRALGLSLGTPVYRVSPPPRQAGEAVVFSLSPAGASEKTGLLQIGEHDNHVSAGHAQSLCWFGHWRF